MRTSLLGRHVDGKSSLEGVALIIVRVTEAAKEKGTLGGKVAGERWARKGGVGMQKYG